METEISVSKCSVEAFIGISLDIRFFVSPWRPRSRFPNARWRLAGNFVKYWIFRQPVETEISVSKGSVEIVGNFAKYVIFRQPVETEISVSKGSVEA